MKQRFATCIFICSLVFLATTSPVQAQEEFFRSKQSHSPGQLENIYAAITVTDSMVFLLAPDYKIYAYRKNTGELRWSRSLNYRSRVPCFAAGGSVYVPYHQDKQSYTARLDEASGEIIKVLPVGPLQTQPVLRNGVLYGTAIFEAGNLFSYELKSDSLLWWKFIAHGMSNQPYFMKDRIIANAESDNWFVIGYDGILRDTTCKQRADIFVQDIPCIENYFALTHDNVRLTNAFSKKYFGEEEMISIDNTLRGKNNSFILTESKLAIIANKGKLQQLLDVPTLLRYHNTEADYGMTRLLLADQNTVTFMYHDQFVHYDFRKQKLVRVLDLSAWEPKQVVAEPGRLWLISGKDGLVYGLSVAGYMQP